MIGSATILRRHRNTAGMTDGNTDQLGFDFNLPERKDGLTAWREQRLAARRKLAEKLGLPLDHPVEVWLQGNIRLAGTLRLREEKLIIDDVPAGNLELEVDGVPFCPGEMESCVRLD